MSIYVKLFLKDEEEEDEKDQKSGSFTIDTYSSYTVVAIEFDGDITDDLDELFSQDDIGKLIYYFIITTFSRTDNK